MFPAAGTVPHPETRREPSCPAAKTAVCSQKRGATLESLGRSGILTGVPGAGLEADEPLTIQQFVDPSEREGLAELAIQDSLKLRPPKRRDVVSWGGASLHSLNEAALLLRRQSSLAVWCRKPTHRFDAAITVGVRPTLYEPSAPANCISDLERLPPLQHQQHAPQPIPLHRVRFLGDQTREPAPIAMLPFDNVHVASLIGSRIIAPQGRWRNMGKKGEGARIKYEPYYSGSGDSAFFRFFGAIA